MKSCRQTASISTKDAEVGADTGLTAHIEPYCGEDWPVSTNVYNSLKICGKEKAYNVTVGRFHIRNPEMLLYSTVVWICYGMPCISR